ncbi:MAG: AAA family ATPase [Clostridium sp.]|uniref:AAA family ATPase n=1 Tax=Clostridium sp. TaxID=1506 RepID=UPI003F3BBE15
MAFKKPQVVKVKTDISSLLIYLRSVKKFGKSTLFRDIILEKFGDPEKGLLVGLGAEVGYSLLDNLNATQAEEWDDLEDLKEWLIEGKGKEHDIRMVAFDVIDELLPMAEEEVMRISKKETGKPCKSFNSAFGGYGEPRKRLVKLVKDYFTDLRKAGIQPFAISHTKVKSIKEKGDDTEGYNILTSNLTSDYESLFGDIFDCVLTGYIDRSVEGNKVTGETRKLYLRGNGFIDAGCRFADGTVPEYIVFDKPNMARTVIDILEEGLRKSRTTPITDKEFKQEQQKEVDELSTRVPEEKGKSQEELFAEKQEKFDKVKNNIQAIGMEKAMEVMQKYSLPNFEDIDAIPVEALDELLSNI